MRRTTRKALVNLGLFGGILFLIIYLNRPSSEHNKTFAWTTIRYKTSSATLPQARGICPGLESSSKPALVVARITADDTTWLNALSDLYHICIYTADAPADLKSTHLQVPENRGNEAMAYLTFLIDNYAHIPTAGAVFVHGSRWAWHNDSPDYDNAALLAALNTSSALAPWGYHNLRCDWSASTCPPSSSPPQGSLEMSMNAAMQPWSPRVASDRALPGALAILFGGEEENGRVLLGRNDAVRSQCCAQFIVSRERVRRHSRDEYMALRQWLLDGSRGGGDGGGGDSGTAYQQNQRSSNAAPRDDRVAGRILSYVWHILFMQQEGVDLAHLNMQACPSAKDCYCRLYGRCELEGCYVPDQCYGQYTLPPDLKLPKDWAATHS